MREPIHELVGYQRLKLCLFDLVLNTALQVGISKNKTLQLNVELTKGGGYALHLTSHF